jgi:hypothetical protein
MTTKRPAAEEAGAPNRADRSLLRFEDEHDDENEDDASAEALAKEDLVATSA